MLIQINNMLTKLLTLPNISSTFPTSYLFYKNTLLLNLGTFSHVDLTTKNSIATCANLATAKI